MKSNGILLFVIIGFILTIVAVMVPQAMYAADYAVDNGNESDTTDTTLMVSTTESTVFWGIGILVFILAAGAILWKFFVS